MSLIQQIEHELPLIAELPREWQMEVALVLSKFIVAYDNTLVKTDDEQRAERERELAAFQKRYQSWDPQIPRAPAIKAERRQR
jgi:hypothetical protein